MTPKQSANDLDPYEESANDSVVKIESKTVTMKDEKSSKDTTDDETLNNAGTTVEPDEDEVLTENTRCEKFINYLFCRSDLAKQKLAAQPVTLKGLFRFATRFDFFLFWIGLTCSVVSGLAQPLLALLSGNVFNLIVSNPVNTTEFREAAYVYVYVYFGMGIAIAAINFIQLMCFQMVCCRMIAQMRHQYMKSILRQNAEWFDKNHSGVLVTQLNDNIERIREGIGDKLGLLVRGFAMFIGGLIIAYIHDWRLALFMTSVAPLTCICMSLMARKLAEETAEELKKVGKAGAIAEEVVLGVRTVQAFNGQKEMSDKYCHELSGGRKHALRKSLWSGLFGGFFYTILLSFMGCGLLLGGYLLKIGVIEDPGNVFIVVMSMMVGAYFLGQISPHLMVLLNARVAAAVIYQTIDRVPKIDAYSDRGRVLMNTKGRVEFKNVHFRYPTRRNIKVLNGLNLTIEPGQTVALVGHSGCGKSTSVGLLTHLYDVESGQVLLDGHDISTLNLEWLRNIIGIVQQEPILFNDTIEENLKIGLPSVTLEKMVEACKMANAHDFVMKLPKGYQTLIGDGGVQLSGGQKQRIAIARTLVRNPKILLLDEATSALDAHSESVVQEALEQAAKGRSTIVIAHRLSTITSADKIAVFDKGEVVEQGTHEELVALGGRYADLVKAQQFTHDEEAVQDTKQDDDDTIHVPITNESRCSSTLSVNLPGRQAFQRGSMMNDSFARSSLHFSAADQAVPTQETEAFQKNTEQQMQRDSEISAGLSTIYLRGAKGNYITLYSGILFAAIRGLEMPLVALTFQRVLVAFEYAKTDVEAMMSALVIVMISYVAIGVATFILQLISSCLFGKTSEDMTLKFRLQTLNNILYQDAAYFDNPSHAPGKLITRLATDAPNVKAVIDSRMQNVVTNVTASTICIVTSIARSWAVGLVGMIMTILLFITQVFLARIIQKKNLSLMRNNNAGKFSIEIIESVRTIQLLTREKYFFQKFVGASKQQKNNELYKGRIEAANFAVSQTFIYFVLGFSYAIGIHLMYTGYNAPDVVYGSIISNLIACYAVMMCSAFFPEFVKARSAAGMLFSMIDRKSTTGNIEEGEKPNLRGNILLDEVHFVYPQRAHQPVMRGLHFTANRGQTIALVGPSGSGKSTVISLLERYYDTLQGSVRYDGMDVKKISLKHLRGHLGLVGQEPRLFAGTIRDNVCFGMEKKPNDAEIFRTLELANAFGFVQKLPQGLDTEVGERGTQLSGGQKQRIAIARALIRNPIILLLDEATSALDSESERAVQEALDRAREGRTCITVAHRLSSIQNADVIVYVENGRVRESGSHTSLIARKGKYYQLMKKQDLNS